MIKAINSPQYHPLSQCRTQIQQLNSNNSRIVYSIRNPILSLANDEFYKNTHWGTPTIFFNNLLSKINLTLPQQEIGWQLKEIVGPHVKFPMAQHKYTFSPQTQNGKQLSIHLQNLTGVKDRGVSISKNHSFKSIPSIYIAARDDIQYCYQTEQTIKIMDQPDQNLYRWIRRRNDRRIRRRNFLHGRLHRTWRNIQLPGHDPRLRNVGHQISPPNCWPLCTKAPYKNPHMQRL